MINFHDNFFYISVLLVVVSYLLGSVNPAILLSKALHLTDPRTQGSGNPGATNVLRTSGKKVAASVLLLDVLKGALVLEVARIFTIETIPLLYYGLAAVVGHIFPLFFRFRGGKGVATALGVLLAWHAGIALVVIGIWAALLYGFRYVSVASVLASASAIPLVMMFQGASLDLVPLCLLVVLVVYKHLPNMQRLLAGMEKAIF